MKKHIILFLLLASSSFSQIDDLKWILGKWEMESEKSIFSEEWTYAGGNTIEGTGMTVSKADGDTLFIEYLSINRFGDEIFYIASVSENSYPVPFKLQALTSGHAVFENWTHDFPQIITYTLLESGTLHAKTEGTKNGEKVTADFYFKKIK